MAILKIVKENEDEGLLRKVSRPVTEITPRILTLLDDMVDTMHKADGCGLAAVQVGVLRRIVVIEVEPGVIHEWINPEIIKVKGKQEDAEGCLSLPGKSGITRRPMTVTVRALNRHGEEVTVTGSGLFARAMCHELDHLDGKLFTDVMIEELDDED
jgi:peptide deformylase